MSGCEESFRRVVDDTWCGVSWVDTILYSTLSIILRAGLEFIMSHS